MKFTRMLASFLLLSGFLYASAVTAQMNPDILALQQHWAEVNYLSEGTARVEAFEKLIDQAELVTDKYPEHAEAWIWSGIIKSTYAGAKGGLGALSSAKSAKSELEKSLQLDPTALNGSAYTTLGTLYLNVPGWPVAFGSKEKAKELLDKALQLAPDDIDNNYFYAEYYVKEKNMADAQRHLYRALSAAGRPGRELADQGRHGDIEKMLQQIKDSG